MTGLSPRKAPPFIICSALLLASGTGAPFSLKDWALSPPRLADLPIPFENSVLAITYWFPCSQKITVRDSVAKTQKVLTKPLTIRYAAMPNNFSTNFFCATVSPFATRLALPFLIMSSASIPRRVRHAVRTEPYPLASHVLRFTFL